MKVVILHDWLTGFRGGERVLEALCELFPEAPIYTLIHQKGSTSPTIEKHQINTSWLNHIPGIHENYRKFLPLFPLATKSLKIPDDTDLVLSSSHCVIKGVTKPKGAKHLCYIHSPMRYIYDQFDSYFGQAKFPIKLAAHFVRPYLQTWDFVTNDNVDHFIANAHFVEERIRFFYGREASVIHPFVDLSDFKKINSEQTHKKDYFLMVTAFAPNKRVDLAIEAFNLLGLNLKIVGTGQEEANLKAKAKSNIEFLGNVSRSDIIKLMSEARAFIFPGVEDFGITPLESLAAGTPVIAYKFGGVLETLTDETAHFFTEATPAALINAIDTFDDKKFHKQKLIARAHEFSREKFKESILSSIDKVLSPK